MLELKLDIKRARRTYDTSGMEEGLVCVWRRSAKEGKLSLVKKLLLLLRRLLKRRRISTKNVRLSKKKGSLTLGGNSLFKRKKYSKR